MNEETKLILKCMSILLSDPDGDNGQIRQMLMREIKETLNPKEDKSISEETKDTLLEQSE